MFRSYASTITTADVTDAGCVFTATTPCGHRVCLQIVKGDDAGHAADWRSYYVLTDCCGAAATGEDGGIVCKDCRRHVPEAFEADVPEALSALGCPCPAECAVDTFDALDAEARGYGL